MALNDRIKDTLNEYISDISRFSLLSREEEIETATAVRAGDKVAREKFVNSNLRLVIRIAKYYSYQNADLLDLIQEGNRGLIFAVDKYDLNRGARFSAYACILIKREILGYLESKASIIRVPPNVHELVTKYNTFINNYLTSHSGPPSLEFILANSELKKGQIKRVLDAKKVLSSKLRLGNFKEDNGSSSIDIPSFDHNGEEYEEMFNAFYDTLNKREQRVITLHYGLFDSGIHTLKEIGDKLDLSKARIGQINNRALNKMAKYMLSTYSKV